MIIGCDKDGVLSNFHKSYLTKYNELKKEDSEFTPIDINLESEEYSFEHTDLIDQKIAKKIRKEYFGEIMDKSEMYVGADDFLLNISKYFSETHVITHQFDNDSKLASLNWMYVHSLPYSCIFCDGLEKFKYCDVLIDDKIENLRAMTHKGKIGICLAREWNKKYEGLRFHTYDEIIEFLKNIKK